MNIDSELSLSSHEFKTHLAFHPLRALRGLEDVLVV